MPLWQTHLVIPSPVAGRSRLIAPNGTSLIDVSTAGVTNWLTGIADFQEAGGQFLRAGSGLSQATNRWQFESETALVPETQNLAAAGNQITSPSRTIIRLNNTSGGPLILTATPTLSNGADGQFCILINVSANPITIQDQAILAGSAMQMGGVSVVLIQWDSIGFVFDSTSGFWVATDNR